MAKARGGREERKVVPQKTKEGWGNEESRRKQMMKKLNQVRDLDSRSEENIILDRETCNSRCGCLKFEKVEQLLFKCEKFEAKIGNLIRKFKSTKSQLNVEILRLTSETNKFQKRFQCFREPKALSKI